MVKIELQMKCTLENLTNLKAEGEDFRWYLKLKCLNCGEETKCFVYLTLEESHPLKGKISFEVTKSENKMRLPACRVASGYESTWI